MGLPVGGAHSGGPSGPTTTGQKLMSEIKINLGAGATPIPGYANLDIKNGEKAYPLNYEDDSVDEIRASHILEHFSHRHTIEVLQEWYRALKPGGTIKIAVPDFDIITQAYRSPNAGKYPLEQFIFGGHCDADDRHGSLFDWGKLKAVLKEVGFVRVEPWESEIDDCAAMHVSLNLMGTKPTAEQQARPNIQAVMSTPRLGFMDNFMCAMHVFPQAGINLRRVQGAFWGQCLERGIQACLDDGADIILTMDYDTVFDMHHLNELMYAVKSYPEYDAFAPLQVSRGNDQLLMCKVDESGTPIAEHSARPYIETDAVPVDSAHFGLTAIRASALRKMPKPWFKAEPAADGGWGDGRVDDDIYFWRKLKRSGGQLAVCPRVAVGHMELMVRWPGPETQAIYQTVNEYHSQGAPENVWQ